jgi:hypothetical protein
LWLQPFVIPKEFGNHRRGASGARH